MRLFFCFVALVLTGANSTFAQAIDFEHFTTLQSAGQVPDDFTVRASIKFNKEKEELSGTSKKEKKDMESFLLEANYQIEDMLYSGRILFGDPITNYLNQIKDEILKADPALRKDIRIYTLMSNDVNAFTFDNGIVIVTTGLVSQVQNEAQLAFILCHEFIHFTEKHSITSYVENRRVERGTGVYASLSNDEEDLAKYRYAKEQETEADKEGLDLYKKTRYSYDALSSVFDVLLYSYLPINEVPFSRTLFNDDLYVLPNTVFLDTLNGITAQEDYNDDNITHPNIKKRKETIIDLLPENADEERSAFLVSETTFHYIQKVARFQGCELYLIDVQFEDALYQAYILQQDDPENAYLKEVVAKALYGWAMYKSANSVPDNHVTFKKVEGESQQVYYLFNKLNAKEFTILALKEVYALSLEQPENKQLKKMSADLGKVLRNEHELDWNNFYTAEKAATYKAAQEAKSDTTTTVVKTDAVVEEKPIDTKTSKYDKIKKEKEKESAGTSDEKTPYWKFAFTEHIAEQSFKDLFAEEEQEEETDSKKSKRSRAPEYSLGLKEVVVVDPVYISVDERSANPVQYVAAEEARTELKGRVEDSADDLGLKVEYLDRYSVNERDAEVFNDMATLRRWIHEKLVHLDEEVYMETSTNDELQALSAKYDMSHFAWMGIVSFTETESNVGAKILMCIYIPLAPFLIYDVLTPDRSTFYFALVANAETGKFDMQYFTSNTLNDSGASQSSNIYYIMQQMKNKKK